MMILFTALLLFKSTFLWAQVETSVDVSKNLESFSQSQDIFVMGVLEEDRLKDSAVKTEVITKDIIQKQQDKSVTEVIERLPGVILEENTGRSGSSAIMQGLSQDQILVMIDGIPQLQTTSSGFDLTSLNTSDIESIEVVKGGSSALYGSHAVGGVINILTNKGLSSPKAKASFESLVSHSDDQENPNHYLGGKFSSPSVRGLSVKADISQNKKYSTDLDEKSLNRDGSDVETVNGKAVLNFINKDTLSAFLSYRFQNQETLNIDTVREIGGAFGRRDNRGKIRKHIYTGGLNYQLGPSFKMRFNSQYENVDESLDLLNDPKVVDQFTIVQADLTGLRSELAFDFFVTDSINLTLGGVYQQESLSQLSDESSPLGGSKTTTSIDAKERITYDLYAQGEVFIGDGIEVTPGVRFQKDSRFASSLSPKINTKVLLPSFKGLQSSLRFSVGTGYRTPSLKENFYILDHTAIGNYIVTGNENLRPEESVSYQAGFEVNEEKSRWNLYTNFFFNSVNDLIDRREVAPKGGTRQFVMVNFDDVETSGVEVSGQYNFESGLSLGLDYGYTKVINLADNLSLPNRPKAVFNMNALYRLNDRHSFLARFRYVGDQFVNLSNTTVSPGFNTVDLKWNSKLSKQVNLSIGINNFLDKTRDGLSDGLTQDEEIRDARPVVGRSFFLGVTIGS